MPAVKYKVRATCPRCGKHHTAGLDVPWTGRGEPRFFCQECATFLYATSRYELFNIRQKERKEARR